MIGNSYYLSTFYSWLSSYSQHTHIKTSDFSQCCLNQKTYSKKKPQKKIKWRKFLILVIKVAVVDDQDHLSFPNFLTHWQIQAPVICILLFLSYLSSLYGYSKSPQLEGPTLGIDNKYGRFQRVSGEKISNISERQCIIVSKFRTWEPFSGTRVFNSIFIGK